MRRRVIHVIPDRWGPHVDIRASYESFASRHAHTEVYDEETFARQSYENNLWKDTLYILWTLHDPGPPDQRHATTKIAHVYAEAMDEDLTKFLPDHLTHWQRFQGCAANFDGVFAHTPWATQFIQRHARAPLVFTMPLGWEADAMGTPRWSSPKHWNVTYHGSPAGRRHEILPLVRAHLGDANFGNTTGRFGRGLLGHLDTSRVSLYVAHSKVSSFSTWRLWQVASTSCAMIAERPVDIWPFSPDCVIDIPYISFDTAGGDMRRILDKALDTKLTNHTARAAHDIAQAFTLEHVEHRYLSPAIERIFS